MQKNGEKRHHSENVKKKCFCFKMSEKITCHAEALFQGKHLSPFQKLKEFAA